MFDTSRRLGMSMKLLKLEHSMGIAGENEGSTLADVIELSRVFPIGGSNSHPKRWAVDLADIDDMHTFTNQATALAYIAWKDRRWKPRALDYIKRAMVRMWSANIRPTCEWGVSRPSGPSRMKRSAVGQPRITRYA